MKLSILALSTTLFASSTLATIGFGISEENGDYHVAWADGQGPCTGQYSLGFSSENPCGILFKLSNGYKYKFEYCGTSGFAVFNENGSYNHICEAVDEKFYCPDSGVNYLVHQQWAC